MAPHRIFYHGDMAGTLSEHQELSLDANGLSAFGHPYLPYLAQRHENHTGHFRRELMLERIRTHNPNVAGAVPSRLRSIFAALTIQDAKVFAHKSTSPTNNPVRVFEIIAPPGSFHFRDMGWLDMPESPDTASDYVSYWLGRLTRNDNDNPFIEVCIDLPAEVGQIVETFIRSEDFVWRAPVQNLHEAP